MAIKLWTLDEYDAVLADEPAGGRSVKSATLERLSCLDEFMASEAPAADVSEDGDIKPQSVKSAYAKLIAERSLPITVKVLPKSKRVAIERVKPTA